MCRRPSPVALPLLLLLSTLVSCGDDGDVGASLPGPDEDLGGSDVGPAHSDAGADAEIDVGQPQRDAAVADLATGADAEDPGPGWPGDDTPAAGLSFGPLLPWASPIDDYLEAGARHSWVFLRGIHDLVVYQQRLYLGYGDANENLGRVTPIEFRYFTDPDSPEAVREFATDEEQIERYRVLGDQLVVAGVDATEDAWLGNVYTRGPQRDWHKSRTLEGGVHVHDVAEYAGAIYAVGSGATPGEWEAGDIFAHLWVSDDGGETFAVAARHHNGGDGDARWTRLLARPEGLYVFGYGSNADFVIDEITSGVWDGEAVTPLPEEHPLRLVLPADTQPLPDGSALVFGVDASVRPLRHGAWRMVGADVRPVAGLAGLTVLDVAPHPPTGEVVLLVEEGDLVSDELRSEWSPRILLSGDMETFEEALRFVTDRPPGSVAYWRGALYFGSGAGEVLRSVGAPDAAPEG